MREPQKLCNLQPPHATLYRAAISVGVQETQLIWTRYSGFIIMNGFIVSALINEKIRDNDAILAFVAIMLLVLNGVWRILNFAGWQNQQLFYRQAGRLFDSDIGLVSDHFRTKNYTPVGWIYWIAQTIPTMFSSIAILCSAAAIRSHTLLGIEVSACIGIAIWVVFACAVLVIEYKLIGRGHAEPV